MSTLNICSKERLAIEGLLRPPAPRPNSSTPSLPAGAAVSVRKAQGGAVARAGLLPLPAGAPRGSSGGREGGRG